MTRLYRKKPLPVEARQVPPSEDGQAGFDLAAWCGGSVSGTYAEPKIFVPTLEGELVAHVGDWILKGQRGEFWPVKGSIFAETYEECPPAGEFFEPGHMYRLDDGQRPQPWLFDVHAVAAEPGTGLLTAFGFLSPTSGRTWIGHTETATAWGPDWTDITPGGDR